MKSIDTLIADIYGLFENPDFRFDEAQIERFGKTLARHIASRVEDRVGAPQLRMSNLGTPCLRKLWYMLNMPEKGEKLDGRTRFKFLYGDLVEALTLFLAEASGHDVSGTQDELDIDGVKGHRDAIIDGVLVDVKSASQYGFKKFAEHGLEGDDPFGYLDQINSYLFASKDDPLLKDKQQAAFLAIDKVLGGMALDFHKSNGVDYRKRIQEIREVVVQPKPPARYYDAEADGKSGNYKLGVACSYCPYKHECWPGLQVYLYSGRNGPEPRYLTKVAREPKVEKATW